MAPITASPTTWKDSQEAIYHKDLYFEVCVFDSQEHQSPLAQRQWSKYVF